MTAAGSTHEGVVETFSRLETKDLVSTEVHRLRQVEMFSGSHAPFIVDDGGNLEAGLYVPRLPVPPRRAKRTRKGGVK
jgi:hypothetical protein